MVVSLDNLNPLVLNDIVQSIDSGSVCYLNKKTNELIEIPEFSHQIDEQQYATTFHKELEIIKKNESDFVKIETLTSNESFNIMKAFTEQLTEIVFQEKLADALKGKKPFQYFKRLVDDSAYRQNWFDFKENKLRELVLKRLHEKK
jgi:hypothetical protein